MTTVLFRIAAVLIVLFDVGHTAGYPWSDPTWRVDLTSIQSTHFDVLGTSRTYWDFYVGFGLFVTVFLLLAAVFAWQLGGLSANDAVRMRGAEWMLALCFASITILAWRYFFVIPVVFSALITLCLIAAMSVRLTQARTGD